MAKISYNNTSPYALTKQKEFYLGLYVDRPIPADSTDITIVLDSKYNHRPDLLAFDLYGDTRYWWIFMRRNLDVIRDPIFEFVGGIEIHIPTKDRILKIVG